MGITQNEMSKLTFTLFWVVFLFMASSGVRDWAQTIVDDPIKLAFVGIVGLLLLAQFTDFRKFMRVDGAR